MTIWFTSDTHFGHANIIKYCNRPFKDTDEMDERLISNWNECVAKDDVIYHLGDFAFADEKRTCEIIQRLNGLKYFIWGNHDKQFRSQDMWMYWDEILEPDTFYWFKDYYELTTLKGHKKQKWVLQHYPILSWNGMHKGSYHLHGHCHGSINHLNTDVCRVDVGVDVWNYKPVSLEQLEKHFSNKKNVDPRNRYPEKGGIADALRKERGE